MKHKNRKKVNKKLITRIDLEKKKESNLELDNILSNKNNLEKVLDTKIQNTEIILSKNINNTDKEIKKIEKNIVRNHKKIIVLTVILIILIFLIIFFMMPKLKIKGDTKIDIVYGNEYNEYGASAKFLNKDLTDKIIIESNVDTKRIGTYVIKYKLKFLFYYITKERIVNIIDNEKPTIELSGSTSVKLCPGEKYKEEGYKSVDNYDGDITDKVNVNILSDKIVYQVSDSSNNEAEEIRNLEYIDTESPSLELKGSNIVYIPVGTNYIEPGYIALDNCVTDIQDKVKVEGNVDTNKVGKYEIIYMAIDGSDNKTKLTRTVNVYNENNTNTGSLIPGMIYLTFDDGPNEATTSEILNILKDEGVKATFFVTNSGPDYLIKRAYDEGHTIGLHTASHNYSLIYANADNYFNDLETVGNRVRNIIGINANLIRFPGGSSNTVSRSYDGGTKIMSYLTSEVTNRGYKYFDWNVDANDAGSCASSGNKRECVYNNVINGLSKNRVNVVLMHDIKYYTKDALKSIIEYGKANGYMFARLDESVQAIHFHVNN